MVAEGSQAGRILQSNSVAGKLNLILARRRTDHHQDAGPQTTVPLPGPQQSASRAVARRERKQDAKPDFCVPDVVAATVL